MGNIPKAGLGDLNRWLFPRTAHHLHRSLWRTHQAHWQARNSHHRAGFACGDMVHHLITSVIKDIGRVAVAISCSTSINIDCRGAVRPDE